MPGLGQTVLYTLSGLDVMAIESRRELAYKAAMAATVPAFAGSGSDVREGDVYPALVVRVRSLDPDAGVNLHVVLDGDDTYWVEARTEGVGPGTWSWPDM